jgi:DNA-binding MarR family transcriptional regulator
MTKTKQKTSPAQPNRQPSKCACTNVRRASRAITKFYDNAMEPSGLKITQFAMLRNIMVSGPLSASELAQILRLDRTTLVRNLKALQDEKYIEGVAGIDSRVRPIAITQKGRSALEAALPYWEKAQATIKARLGAEDLEKFVSILMDIEALAG